MKAELHKHFARMQGELKTQSAMVTEVQHVLDKIVEEKRQSDLFMAVRQDLLETLGN